MNTGESLLDTFPGRLFIDQLLRGRGAGMPEDLIGAATQAVARYLYSDGCLDVAHFDARDFGQLESVWLSALSGLRTFGSPQIHQGTITELRSPRVRNREPLSALPDGAFWTSTAVTDEEDSWTLCGENLARGAPRWEVHFDVKRARVVTIDSARDWADLIDSHPAASSGCRYPNWPAIAESWDAVHLSAAGLLLAHPTVSGTPFNATDGCGYAHSRAGTYASVAEWSAVSTAWLRTPPNAEIRHRPATSHLRFESSQPSTRVGGGRDDDR